MHVRVLVGPGDDGSMDDLDGARVVGVATVSPDEDVRHPDGRGCLSLLLRGQAVASVHRGQYDAQTPQGEHPDEEDTYKDYYDSVPHLEFPSWSRAARASTMMAQTTCLLSIKALRPPFLQEKLKD